jgi:3',5'-cyclic AMP phosphodiesterase CpdA
LERTEPAEAAPHALQVERVDARALFTPGWRLATKRVMVSLVHISDPHLGPLPPARLRELASKRILGFINWQRHRRRVMQIDLPSRLVAAVQALAPDHIAVTGDLVNIALPAEFATARMFLQALGDGRDVSVIPGNHDAYVRGSLDRATTSWQPWMQDDSGETAWPFVRRRGNLAIIGVSSAKSTGPFMATGMIGHPQAERLAVILSALGREGLCRVVLIHHPPQPNGTHWHKRLVDARRFRRVIAQAGTELVLHGHTHLPTVATIDGPDGTTVPVLGISAATQSAGGRKPASGFNHFSFEKAHDTWRINRRRFEVSASTGEYTEVEQDMFAGGKRLSWHQEP